jgi:hypothetical protein
MFVSFTEENTIIDQTIVMPLVVHSLKLFSFVFLPISKKAEERRKKFAPVIVLHTYHVVAVLTVAK